VYFGGIGVRTVALEVVLDIRRKAGALTQHP
jgi:hypothetical protein